MENTNINHLLFDDVSSLSSESIIDIIDSIDSLDISDNINNNKILNKNCIKCNSININYENNYYICYDCGLINSHILDNTTDWNSINSSEDNLSRCSCATSYFFPQSSLGTKVSNGKFSKLSILERWSQMPYKERSRYD